MRETLWLWLRGSPLLRKLYSFSPAHKLMNALSYLLVPSNRKRRLQVRKGPGAGLAFELNPRWERHLWEGQHELKVQQTITERLAPGDVFYDIGAGFGFYSCLAARLRVQVFAFEPDDANAQSLLRQAELNTLGPSIKLVKLAVVAKSGLTNFEPAPQERGHGNGQVTGLVNPNFSSVNVPCTSLDDFILQNPLPNLIKIDVEGAESEVLSGAEELFRRGRPVVLCEVHDAANARYVSAWLDKRSYSVQFIGVSNEYPTHLVATPN
jgi:FkbM family methyltransferase